MKRLWILIMGSLLLLPCRVCAQNTFADYETTCLGTELDGSLTLRAWGKGKNNRDAREQAMKNAVRDVIFKGITAGSGECNYRPLLTEVNAAEKYEDYFNKFFRDGGAYKNFVSKEDEKRSSRVKVKNRTQNSYGIVVRVLRAELREKLIEDNILKP